MMQENYFRFLDHRASQRRLASQFAHPRWLALNTLAFIVAATVILVYGTVWMWWYSPANYVMPTLFGLGWSALLLVHAIWHYRHSAASAQRREVAVEAEMRQMFASSAEPLDDQRLFDLHHLFEADLEREGGWSAVLLTFAVINLLSWGISALTMGTTWPFQTTLPFAIVILGGGAFYMAWQRQRHTGADTWFTRIPLRHIVIYAIGAPILALLGMYHAINLLDAQTLIVLWLILVLAHILLSVVILPLIERFMPRKEVAKRKPGQRLMLGDDGELVEFDEPEIRQARADRS